MLAAARQWGELAPHLPDACANIAKNPRRPVARYLDREELQRLGAALDRHRGEHPSHVAALRLFTLTGARLSEALNLRRDEVGELSEDGASARLEDSKTGPRTVWLRPEAAWLLAALPRPEGAKRVFPEDLTPDRLYTFWCGIRGEAGLPGLRIHDARHTWATQGVMNGVGLTTVGRLLGHRERRTTAIYAHLGDATLRDAAAVIAGAMGYKAKPPPLPDEADGEDAPTVPAEFMHPALRQSRMGRECPCRLGRETGDRTRRNRNTVTRTRSETRSWKKGTDPPRPAHTNPP